MRRKSYRAFLIAAMLALIPSTIFAQAIGLGIGMDDLRRVKVIGGGAGTNDLLLVAGGYITLIAGGKIKCVVGVPTC